MKRLIILFLGAAVSIGSAAAQDYPDLFDEFARSASQEYEDFQNEANRMFADMLREAWEEFRVLTGIKRPDKPEPEALPVAPTDTIPSSVALPEPEFSPVVDEPKQEPSVDVPEAVKPSDDIPIIARKFEFAFYDVHSGINVPEEILNYSMKGNKEDDVADFWGYLSKCNYAYVLEQSQSYARKMGFNDWTWYMWIDVLADVIYGESRADEREVFKTFMLNMVGTDAKLGLADGRLVTMTAIKEQVYSRLYCDMNSKNYYFDPDITEINEFYSYETDFPLELYPISLEFHSPLQLSDDKSDGIYRVLKHSTVLSADFYIPIDERLCSFYLDFPQVDVDIYARAAVSQSLVDALMAVFKPYMNGKTDLEKVTLLMNFMHHDFDYATDQEQFGYEKPFFVAEDFVYPYNDCEDRSILFSFLVHNLTGLDVVLIDYPDHIATAVCFNEDIAGDYFICNGKRYIICDPTYIGAPVGLTMEGYSTTPFKVLTL